MKISKVASPVPARSGISLLEVLVSIGILSIGLLSMLSLLPAGRTYLVKAERDDRAAALVPNAIAEMHALGLFSDDALDWQRRRAQAACCRDASAKVVRAAAANVCGVMVKHVPATSLC